MEIRERESPRQATQACARRGLEEIDHPGQGIVSYNAR